MPPFLVAIAVAAIAALAYRKNAISIPKVSVPTTPSNNPAGIITSFASPPVAVNVNSAGQIEGPSTIDSVPSLQTNAPGTSASGVPAWSSNAQEFVPVEYTPTPAPLRQVASSYAGPIQQNIQPRFRPVKVNTPKPKTDCGCGGSCGSGSCANPSDCASAKARNRDGGCLAPTSQAQLQDAGPVLARWAANVASSGGNSWLDYQQRVYDMQESSPASSDVTVPASPFISGIGISPNKPLRTAFAANQ